MEKIKILLDTDIGDDIDDSFALALAANSPELEIVAVTTVFKNVRCRAKQAIQLLNSLGKGDIPVYRGEGTPLSKEIPLFQADKKLKRYFGNPVNLLPCQFDDTMDTPTRTGGVDAIIEMAKKYSGELIVVTIGPLTNLALAVQKDPSIVKDIKRVYMMGGHYSHQRKEWNIMGDPKGAKVVFNSGLDVYAVGCDITMRVSLPNETLKAVKTSEKPHNILITKWLERWHAYFHWSKSVLHDPLVIGCVFDDFCPFKEKYVKVVRKGWRRGSILLSDTPKERFAKIHVAYDVDKDRFLEVFKERIL